MSENIGKSLNGHVCRSRLCFGLCCYNEWFFRLHTLIQKETTYSTLILTWLCMQNYLCQVCTCIIY